jgi:two-component system, LytTR family, response regulator
MTAILIDDELNCLDALEADLNEYCPEIKILAKFQSPLIALEQLKVLNPTIVFLDIEMPFLNGFEFLKKVENINFEVIFITAYDQFAIKAFQFSAVDYLLKPVDSNLLIQAVQKVKKYSKTFDNQRLSLVLESLKNIQQNTNLFGLLTSSGIEFIDSDKISIISIEDEQTTVYLINGEKIVTSKTMKEMEKTLENMNFLRVHLSYIINLNQVKKYINGDGGELLMNDGRIIPVSRNGKPKLLSLLYV